MVPVRKPLALSNWKMALTVAESLALVREFETLAGDLLDLVEVVICPPYTSLWPVAQALRESRIQLGGQNIAATTDLARTGEISAALLADVDCRWVMLGTGKSAVTWVMMMRRSTASCTWRWRRVCLPLC